MAAGYRYRCGECPHRTTWLTESQGEAELRAHYAGRHPGIVPGGRVEARRRRTPDGSGCLLAIVVLLLLAFIAASCQYGQPSATASAETGRSTHNVEEERTP